MPKPNKPPLSETHPELAAQADGWDPSTQTAGSSKKFSWKCVNGHSWIASISNRSRGSGCSVCAGKQVAVGHNDLATVKPEIAAEAYGWNPQTVVAFSGKHAKWKCARGHIWSAVIASRSSGRGCPVCAGKQILKGFNDLMTLNPNIAEEAKEWDPSTVSAGSHQKLKWCCSNGHEYFASPHSRTGVNRTGCPICSGQQVLGGFNDLRTSHRDIAGEAFEWNPETVNAGSNTKRRWQCAFGHVWMASPHNRTGQNKSGCPICTNKQVLVGFNDLQTVDPELAQQAFGWHPSSLTKSSRKRRKWRCQFGHIWTSTVADRTRGNGCPTCSVGGFDPNRDAWLYLVEHDEWKMLQIGKTTQPKVRLESHGRIGWRLIELRGPLNGHHIQELETTALRSLKARQAIFANSAGGKAFDGWTEAWTKKSLNVTSINQILKWVYEDESK